MVFVRIGRCEMFCASLYHTDPRRHTRSTYYSGVHTVGPADYTNQGSICAPKCLHIGIIMKQVSYVLWKKIQSMAAAPDTKRPPRHRQNLAFHKFSSHTFVTLNLVGPFSSNNNGDEKKWDFGHTTSTPYYAYYYQGSRMEYMCYTHVRTEEVWPIRSTRVNRTRQFSCV